MTRVLVTGCTGYVGGALLRDLTRSGIEVSALLHNRGRGFLLPADTGSCTLDELEADGPAYDALVHLGYGTGLGRKDTLAKNLAFNKRLLNVAARAKTKVIYASTIVVAGHGGDPRMDYLGKLQRYSHDDTYTYVKGRLENYVLDTCAKRQVPLTVLRIGNVMGPSSIWTRTLLANLTKRVQFLADDAPSNATSIFNLVALLKREIESPEASGITLSTEMAEISWRQWAENLTPERLKGVLDVGELQMSETSPKTVRMLPRLAAGVYGAVMSDRLLKSIADRAPRRLLAMAGPWLKVPLVRAGRGLGKPVLSETEKVIFSCKNTIPAVGVTEFTFEETVNRIMDWAVWANFFVEHGISR
jgi:nucleoside-diphosphate-sugar epimerase